MTLQKLTLVLGGAASGKSDYAENLVGRTGLERVYIATAQLFDAEMAAKAERHRKTRGPGWHTIEEPFDLPSALATVTPSQAVLIDCATLWLSNLILADHDPEPAATALLAAVERCPGPVVIVSNEVGQGIVPDTPLGRRFRNAQGGLNRRLAARADLVVAVMAGLPLTLKGQLP